MISVCAPGCFRERSFPITHRDEIRLASVEAVAAGSTRDWLSSMHRRLADTLPDEGGPRALLSEQMSAGVGAAIDVERHFGIGPEQTPSVWHNLSGLTYSAEATGGRFGHEPPAWPGFEDVWIRIDSKLSLAGRLAIARQGGRARRADAIIVMAGLFGDNTTLRSRDVSIALHEAGYHVLALEPRGHGATQRRYPQVPYTYGVLDTADLIRAAHWLQDRPEVMDTGAIGFCWSANVALLAAWEDGRSDDDPDVPARLSRYLPSRNRRPILRAGVLAFSPAIAFEALLEKLEDRWTKWSDPTATALGKIVDGRAAQRGYPRLYGNLRELCRREAADAMPGYAEREEDGLRYIRFVPHRGMQVGPKLDQARVPVLIVYGANDPVCAAQPVADLMASVNNPNVAAVILPDGGHCGFAPYAPSYFYSLLLNFFDRDLGAAAATGGRRATVSRERAGVERSAVR